MPSVRGVGLISLGFLVMAPAYAQPGQMLAASTVNGKSIRVYATGSGKPRVSLSQVNATAQIRFDGHEILVADDGTVTIDGVTRSQGAYTALEIVIGDGNSIDLKVTR